MKYITFILLFFILSCAKQQSLLICGDHKCVNKAEAKQYLEENLTIEIQIISKDKKSRFDLVDLNLGNNEQKIKVFKNQNNKIVKKLSKEQIKAKKKELKKKKNIAKLETKKIIKKDDLSQKKKRKTTPSFSSNTNSIDICLKLEKCDIDSITNYLIKISNEKDFPNISLKE